MIWKPVPKLTIGENDRVESAKSAGKTYVASFIEGLGGTASITARLGRDAGGFAARRELIGDVGEYGSFDAAKAACEAHRTLLK